MSIVGRYLSSESKSSTILTRYSQPSYVIVGHSNIKYTFHSVYHIKTRGYEVNLGVREER